MRQVLSKPLQMYERCVNYLYQWILFHESEENIQEITQKLKEIRLEVFGDEEKEKF